MRALFTSQQFGAYFALGLLWKPRAGQPGTEKSTGRGDDTIIDVEAAPISQLPPRPVARRALPLPAQRLQSDISINTDPKRGRFVDTWA